MQSSAHHTRSAKADPRFPVRVAAVDVGSNAIRFLAAEFSDRRRWREIDSERVPVRLGHQAFLTGRLDPEAMDRAVGALADFRRRIDALGIRDHRAVATSAVRESRNGPELMRRAEEEAGMRLDVVSGAEEARLVWVAVRGRLAGLPEPWVLVDLGGGSLELSLVDREGIRWSESHTLGTVRILDELGDGGEISPERVRRLLDEHTDALRVPSAAREFEARVVVATGGNIEALAKIGGEGPDEHGTGRISVEALAELTTALAALSCEQRMRAHDLRKDRADVILPAAVVYRRVAELCGAREIRVPNAGVKEGILLDLVEDRTP